MRNWRYSATRDDENLGDKVLVELSDRWGAAILDEMHCLAEMTRPGELLSRAEQGCALPKWLQKEAQLSRQQVGESHRGLWRAYNHDTDLFRD